MLILMLCAHSQVEKAKRSEQSVAVCVLEVHATSDAKEPSRQYLLVQRPKEGLLAGMGQNYSQCDSMQKQLMLDSQCLPSSCEADHRTWAYSNVV